MRSTIGALSAAQDSLNLTSAIAGITQTALTSVLQASYKIRDDLVEANEAGIDESAMQADISTRQSEIINTAKSASFDGTNWLVGNDTFSQDITVDYNKLSESQMIDGQLQTSEYFKNVHISEQAYDSSGSTLYHHDHSGSFPTLSANQTVTGAGVYAPFTKTSDALTKDPNFQTSRYVSSVTSSGNSVSNLDLTGIQLFTTGVHDVYIQYRGDTYSDSEWIQGDSYIAPINSFGIDTGGIFDKAVEGVGADGPTVVVTPSGNITASGQNASMLTMSVEGQSKSQLASMSGSVDQTIKEILAASQMVGAFQTKVSTQAEFNTSLSNALTSGVGTLVDADMNLVSTRLAALQTQQQLAVQSLGIANENSEMILKLFQG